MNTEKQSDTGRYGIKDIYEASIKAAVPMDVMGVHYDVGDTILYFDRIQEVLFQENKNVNDARGAFDNRSLVYWETTKEVNCIMNMGTVSHLAFGMMNGNVIKRLPAKKINQYERIYVGTNGKAKVRHSIDTNSKISIYKLENDRRASKILDYEIDGDTLILEEKNIDILVDYYFIYDQGMEVVNVGQKDLNGYLMFVGKFRYTDEYTAVQKTGLIEIPRLRINSNFAINLGRNTNPLVSALQFQAIPLGSREQAITVSVSYLDEDIDGDF